MGRSSRADAAMHREQVVTATSRLLRERGSGVSVQDVMATAGMTHGGFYKHFGSKDELVAVAATAAFDDLNGWFEQILADASDKPAARRELLRDYLSPDHRDDPGGGCASTALACDTTRAPGDSPLHESYVDGLAKVIDMVAEFQDTEDGAEARRRAVIEFATMVGALTLSRAAGKSALSDEILDTVRESLDRQA